MRVYTYGASNVNKAGCIFVDIGPFWTFALEKIVEGICVCTPRIPLPKSEYRDLGTFFCIRVHNEISNICWNKQRHIVLSVKYDELKDSFYEFDKKYWDDIEKYDIGDIT